MIDLCATNQSTEYYAWTYEFTFPYSSNTETTGLTSDLCATNMAELKLKMLQHFSICCLQQLPATTTNVVILSCWGITSIVGARVISSGIFVRVINWFSSLTQFLYLSFILQIFDFLLNKTHSSELSESTCQFNNIYF